MIKKLLAFIPILAVIATVIFILHPSTAHASFNANDLMDDSVFNNTATMSAGQINTFLNTLPSSCISTNHGFSAADPTGYSPSGGYTYGNYVSAGQVIYDAALAYGLNPQVLLTTLQKEQSLVDGTAGCSVLRYAGATGYGCPDGGTTYNWTPNPSLYAINGVAVTSVSGTCVNSVSKVGFSQQAIHAAWLLRFGEQRSEGNVGWDAQSTNFPESGDSWNNSDDPQSCYSGPMTQGTFQQCPGGSSVFYDGYTTIDSTSTYMGTGATAALYYYTPHFAGNQNFDTIFQNWFGSLYTPNYSWSIVSQNTYTDASKATPASSLNMVAGSKVYAVIVATNTGNIAWSNSGANAVHLATTSPQDRTSAFCDTSDSPAWISCNRAATTDESSVAPGGTGTFEFWYKAPASPGTYNEHFSLVEEGLAWMNDPGLYFHAMVTFDPTVNANNVGTTLGSSQTLNAGQSITSANGLYKLVMQGDGNLVLYSINRPLWASNTAGKPVSKVVMQSDGNLVLYDNGGRSYWSSNTAGKGASSLIMQSDGNLVIYNASGNPTWDSSTNGQL